MNENVERVLDELDEFRVADEMTYAAYSRLHDSISELDDLLKAQELPDVKPEKLEERTTKWLDQMTAEERLEEIAAILDDWDGYRTAKGLGGLINEVWAYALYPVKAQEPRVMTLEELWHMEHKPVYLERKNSRLYITEPSIVLKTERCYIPSLGDSYILMRENKIHDKYWTCDYNKTWRCWTSRPTDEQRKATPWVEPPKGGK